MSALPRLPCIFKLYVGIWDKVVEALNIPLPKEGLPLNPIFLLGRKVLKFTLMSCSLPKDGGITATGVGLVK